ncbi:PH domain-containing protein [Aquibacillus kalidii]|uniref:hypothetical protein n=1 Tax=Aquibacillus kalidii TaxID=2762597 RepID=UPI0016455302|nr:hypothetical protein [Aquibacillus kalidii]
MKKEIEQKIIEQYQKEENMMILVFAQWCINHNLNPLELYIEAYPDQQNNPALLNALELTVPKEEAGEISDQTVLSVLQLFGNDDLAFIVSQKLEKHKK